MSLFKEAINDLKRMGLLELVYTLCGIIVMCGALFALIGDVGPLVPITDYLNYLQAIFWQSIFGGELKYSGKLTFVIVALIWAIPLFLAKRMYRSSDSK